MSNFNENYLLRIFKELDIQLHHLDPNVVKAWFDTDDKNLINLLNWMCMSLSSKNYISPLELAEYSTITSSLSNENLQKEKNQLENKYPGIFDIECNALEIEFLEEELSLARQQENKLDESIIFNRNLEENLSKHLSKKLKDEIEVSVRLKTAQERCLTAGEKLDALNKNIFDQIVESTNILYNFEFGQSPSFISNFNVNVYQEKLDNMSFLLKPVLDKSHSVGNVLSLKNVTSLDIVPLNETMANNLCCMRQRIFLSHSKYLATLVGVDEIKDILSNLEKVPIKTLISSDENSLNQSIALKMETRRRLCDMLEDATKKIADWHISQTQVKYIQQELEMQQATLDDLSELENMVQKLLSHYSTLSIMFDLEKKEMENFEIFLKQVITYMSRDIETCVVRTEKMKEIIDNYQSSASDEKLKLVKTIIKLLSTNEENFTISRAYELISNFKTEITFLESKLFSPGFSDFMAKGKDLRDSVKILQSFLVSGPTHRVLLVPTELQIIIRQVEELLERELEVVRTAMNTMASAKKLPSKWQNYRRQLWMYFYADPDGLKFILEQIQKTYEQLKNTKT